MQIAAKIAAFALGLAVLLFFLWPALRTAQRQAWQARPKDFPPLTSAVSSSALPAARAEATAHVTADDPRAITSTLSGPSEPTAAQVQAVPPEVPQTVGEEKQHRLASEQAEIERLAGLEQEHAIKPAPNPTKRYYKVKVRDGGTLEAGAVVIRLDGIEAREANGNCTDDKGKDWPCGAAARVALTKFIRYRAISCVLPKGGEQAEYTARCSVGSMDLSTWMVRQGWARPKAKTEQALGDASEAAKQAHLGIWRTGE